MVVKVQRSLFTTASEDQILIYNEDKSVFVQEPMTLELRALFAEDEYKFFAEAEVDGARIDIGRRVPDPGW